MGGKYVRHSNAEVFTTDLSVSIRPHSFPRWVNDLLAPVLYEHPHLWDIFTAGAPDDELHREVSKRTSAVGKIYRLMKQTLGENCRH